MIREGGGSDVHHDTKNYCVLTCLFERRGCWLLRNVGLIVLNDCVKEHVQVCLFQKVLVPSSPGACPIMTYRCHKPGSARLI